MARITDPHWFWRGREGQLVVRAGIAEDLPTVSTVVLSPRDGELLLTQFTDVGVFVLQPDLSPLEYLIVS